MHAAEDEENLLRSAALQNAKSVLTARRRAGAALERKSDELAHAVSMLRATLESTTDGIMVTDESGAVTDYNARFVETWRLPPEIVETRCHQKWLDFISSQLADPVKFHDGVREIVASLSPASFQLWECTDGRVLECHTKVQRIGERIVGRVWSLRDITERRKAESILRRSEKMLADLFDNAAVGLHLIGTNGRILRANRTELEMLGYSQEEFVGHFIEEFYVNAPVIADVSPKLVRGEALDNHEARLRCKDGSIKDVLISCNGLWEDGKLVHSRCFTRDITEIKRAEAARARLATLVESSADAIVSKTLDGTICTWNKGAEQMFGYKAEEVVGKSVLILIPPDRVSEEARILERLRRGESVNHYETVRRRKDGTLIDISLTVSPIRDAKGSITGASKIARDITGRKLAEAALQASESRFRQLADAMPQMVWTARPDGYADYLNRRWYDYTGVAEGMTGDESWTPFLHPDDLPRCREIWGKSLATGQPYQIEYRIRNRTGEYRWHLGRALATRNEAGEIVRWYGSFTDIHEQKLTADALREANQTKDDFLSALSHELRTPLTPVLAILSSLREDSSIPPTLAADLEMMLRNVELETRLIDDLLDLTRITRRKLELRCEPVAIDLVIETAINTCLTELNDKELILIRDLQAPRQTVSADRTRIIQILWNLLKNSIKFTPSGGIITVRSHVTSTNGNGQVFIMVEDTGIGMEPEQVARVFDAFEQGDRTIARHFGGLGLGLAISKAIAVHHGGMISATSDGPGRGSIFTLTLPCATHEEFPPAATPTHNLPAICETTCVSPKSRPLRILLVEDHDNSAAILSRLLRRSGHEVVHAATVADALRIADEKTRSAGLDLIISDLGLPDGSGLDLMRKLSIDYGLRGIALSGFGMESDRAESRAAGFSRHLTKPIDIADLRNAIVDMAQTL
jgi:PAS domain S-box-containing protein